ncbi:MAG: hypothetical protein ABSE47_16950 [Acidimicrobiales bacterium]
MTTTLMFRAFRRGGPRRLGGAVALAAIVLGATACSSSSSSSTTTTTPASGSTTATTSAPGGGSTTSTTGASGSASLSELESKLASGQTATFLATYAVQSTTSGKSTKGTFTLAHDGSSSLVGFVESTGAFEEIKAGSAVYLCTKTTASWQCFSGAEAATLGASVTAVASIYGSSAALDLLKADAAEAGATESSSTFAGQPVTCLTFPNKTTSGTSTVCVTSNGVLAEEKATTPTGNVLVTLQSFSTSVPSSEFTPPATPSTIPTGSTP